MSDVILWPDVLPRDLVIVGTLLAEVIDDDAPSSSQILAPGGVIN